MIRVALETATRLGTVAVARDDRVRSEVELGAQTRHAEGLIPALERALEQAGVSRDAIDEVVVGAGPGSFTGVRVAGATAKGLAAALDVPVRAYSSLLALAAGVDEEADLREVAGPVCGLFDARRGEVYAGCWWVGEELQELLPPTVGPVEDVVAALAASVEAGDDGGSEPGGPMDGLRFVGAGAEAYRDLLEAVCPDHGLPATVAAGHHPRAASLLRLAHRYPAEGVVGDRGAWEPTYVRGSSAERGIAG